MSSPNTSGVRAESAFSRSWFSAAAPPMSEPAGSSERSRSMVAPVAGAEASVVGMARVIVQPLDVPAGIVDCDTVVGAQHRGGLRPAIRTG